MEWNKSRRESRTIQIRPVSGETIGFPLAEQAARLRRQVKGRDDELVALVTSAEPRRLAPQQWLGGNRLGWDIETGLHLRLDVSHNDDLCRIRKPKSMWVVGMLRRLANSLFMHWRDQHPKPKHKTTTDFHTHLEEDNLRRGLRFLKATRPSLRPSS